LEPNRALSLSPPFLSIFLAETKPSSEAQFDQTVGGETTGGGFETFRGDRTHCLFQQQ